MIYSRFGSEFEIIKGDLDTGMVTGRRKDDGKIFPDCHITEFRADGGIQEIHQAIHNLVLESIIVPSL